MAMIKVTLIYSVRVANATDKEEAINHIIEQLIEDLANKENPTDLFEIKTEIIP